MMEHDAEKTTLSLDPAAGTASLARGGRRWELALGPGEPALHVRGWTGPELDGPTCHHLLDVLLARTGAPEVVLDAGLAAELPLHRHPWHPREGGVGMTRTAFYQLREPWLAPALLQVMPHVWTHTGEVRHPLRPAVSDGVLYRRFIPALDRVFELRRATVAADGGRFHRWQNDPRVAEFWEYAWSRERLDAYLEERRADPHCEPLIGSFDGEPFAYVETYWVPEDRLGPYCRHDPFDQGFHFLVGEPEYRGDGRTVHWLNAVFHFLFLLEPRTATVFGEPRADNRAVLKYAELCPWEIRYEFDFPHKRAVLVACDRGRFFTETRL